MAASARIRTKLFDFALEPGEARPCLLLSLYLLLAIASMTGLKAAANSMFLAQFSARDLPFVYLAVAALMALIVPFYLKWAQRLPQNRLVIYTQLFLASHLVLFWWLGRMQWKGLAGILYVWTEMFSVIVPTQVWSLANHLFTTRQAKRLFPLVGSGGLLGAALGGLFSRALTLQIGTRNLLLTYVTFLLACGAIVAYLWRSERILRQRPSGSKQTSPTSLAASVRTIRASRYLSLMTMLVALSAVVNILVDYQFRFIVEEEFIGRENREDGMTALFSAFSSYLAVFSFLMHLILTSRLMRWLGLNFAIFILPFSMLLGSGMLLFTSTLLAAMVIKGFDGTFRHSIDRSANELLYVPLASRVKQHAKPFIDMVAGRWAVGLGGLLLFLVANVWKFDVQQISYVNLSLVVPWLAAAWMLRREYMQTLRSSIERKDTSADALLLELAGSSPSEEITETLASSDERAVESGLGWLQYGQVSGARAHLASLLTHMSPAIRRKAMAVVAAKDAPDCGPQVAKFLYLDDQVESMWLALDYLERHDPEESHTSWEELLASPHPVLRGAAAARLLGHPDSPHRPAALASFAAFVEAARGPEPALRPAAAQLLGLAPADLDCQSSLADFLADPDPEVVRAAIVSAGSTRRKDLLPKLVELAGVRKHRTEARQALAAFGLEVLPALRQALLDSHLPLRVRRNLPRVFSAVGGQGAADQLALCLDQPDPLLGFQVLRALSRIRLKQPEVSVDSARVSTLTLDLVRRYYRYLTILHGVPQNGVHPGSNFLRRALAERMDRQMESIFRLIGLLHPAKEIFDAYYAIRSGPRDLRANALEYLEGMLVNPLRQQLLPIVEDRSPDRILDLARSQFGIERRTHREALRELVNDPDPWLQSCAIFAAAGQGLGELSPLLEPLLDAEDELLQETARAAHERLRAAGPQPGASWKL